MGQFQAPCRHQQPTTSLKGEYKEILQAVMGEELDGGSTHSPSESALRKSHHWPAAASWASWPQGPHLLHHQLTPPCPWLQRCAASSSSLHVQTLQFTKSFYTSSRRLGSGILQAFESGCSGVLSWLVHQAPPCPHFISLQPFFASQCWWRSQVRTSMRLGLLSQDGIQPDRQPDALATGRQQRSIERERRWLGPVQGL